MAKVAKTKNSGTYKNLVGATNYYNAVMHQHLLVMCCKYHMVAI